MNKMRQRKTRRSFPAAWILLVLLIAVTILLTAVLYNHTDRKSHGRGKYYAEPVSEQAILLVSSDGGHLSRRYSGLQTAFADAGISSMLLQISKNHTLTVIEQIEQAMERLAHLSGQQPEQQWLLAEGKEAVILAENAGKIMTAGFVYLCPAELDRVSATVWSVYPDDRPTIILTEQDGPDADQAISLFEQQTGEDARLFSGASASGLLSARQYRSVDGRFVLKQYPLLRNRLSTHDIRIISDISGELAAYNPATAERINLISATAALSQLIFLRYYLLIGLLILSLPVVYTIALRKKTAALILSAKQNCFVQRNPWVCALFWLPAIALCIGLSFLINQWIYPLISLWVGVLFFLPGSYGLVSWIASVVSRQPQSADKIVMSGQPDSDSVGSMRSIIFINTLVCTLFLIIFMTWRWLMFGWYSGLKLSPLIMGLFFVWNIPGVWPEQHSLLGKIKNQRRFLPPVWQLIFRRWPYLVLLAAAPILIDGAALMIFVILMAFLYWSDLAGRTVTILTGRCWIGRLVRSLLLTLSWFHPALLPSIFY